MTLDSLVLHDRTREQIKQFIDNPSHALAVAGPTGSGKQALCNYLAIQILEITMPIVAYPYILVVEPAKNKVSIGIEEVREIEHFLSLKVPRQSNFNRAILIYDAQLMTHEAQNALLKTLEEPPHGTLIVLTTDNDQNLLPTIRSRMQLITVKNPALSNVLSFFEAQGKDVQAIKRAYSMSGGLPGLMHALLHDIDHPLLKAADQARAILGANTYERLLLIDTLAKDKALMAETLFILQQMAHVSLQRATGSSAKQWQKVLTAAYEANQAITNSAQPKLALSKLMLSL